jgi:hypothetical protein
MSPQTEFPNNINKPLAKTVAAMRIIVAKRVVGMVAWRGCRAFPPLPRR